MPRSSTTDASGRAGAVVRGPWRLGADQESPTVNRLLAEGSLPLRPAQLPWLSQYSREAAAESPATTPEGERDGLSDWQTLRRQRFLSTYAWLTWFLMAGLRVDANFLRMESPLTRREEDMLDQLAGILSIPKDKVLERIQKSKLPETRRTWQVLKESPTVTEDMLRTFSR